MGDHESDASFNDAVAKIEYALSHMKMWFEPGPQGHTISMPAYKAYIEADEVLHVVIAPARVRNF